MGKNKVTLGCVSCMVDASFRSPSLLVCVLIRLSEVPKFIH